MPRCKLCADEYERWCNSARSGLCQLCASELVGKSYGGDEALMVYVAYRARMRMKYDDGPWTPDRVAPQDRWTAWQARRSRAS